MRVVVQDTLRNRQWVGYEGAAGFTVGRNEECSVVLDQSRFVSRRHLQVERSEAGWELAVNGGALTVDVDGSQVGPGDTAQLKPVSRVRLAEFVLTFLQDVTEAGAEKDTALEDVNSLQRELHATVLRGLDLRRSGSDQLEASTESLEQINAIMEDLLHKEFRERVFGSHLTRNRLLGMVYDHRLLAKLAEASAHKLEIEPIHTPGANIALDEAADEFVGRLVRRMDLAVTPDAAAEDLEKVNSQLESFLPDIIAETPDNIQFYIIARFLKKVVCDMIFGLGPLQDLLDTPAITEIMIVSPEQVYVERGGRVVRSSRSFLGDEALLAVIERIVAPLGRRIDRSQPLVDARLKDGSRVNAIIPPLALKGPCLTIRRFPEQRVTAEDLVKWGSMTDAACSLVEGAVRARKNIVVAGGTGSGKTTLLNVLSSFIPEDERIITIEDAAELQLDQEHLVSLETRPANVEGKGAYTIRDLVKNALRMRPDRVIVGECRGEEAFDMLQAMNTGHDGSMTTVHANSSFDVIARIETMCLMAVEIPVAAIRRQITQAVDMIVFIRRLKGGRRIITQITEVTGLHPNTGEVEMRDVMHLAGSETEPKLVASGYMPTFLGDLADAGLIDLERWFETDRMTPLVLAILLGVSGALLVWSLRGWLRARWDTDVAWLSHAVWRFTPEPFNARPYVAGYYIGAALLLFGALMIFRFPTNAGAVVVWGVLLLVPKLLVERAWTKRRKQVDAQLPMAVLQVSSNVAAGMSLIQAVERVSERSPAPISSEFGIMANYWNLGADFSATMEEAKRRLRLENFNLFASALLINQKMGGNVVDTLDRLAHSLEAIEQMRKEVYVATAEGRTNVKVLTIAPLIMLAFGALMDFEAVTWLFTRSVGHILLGLAVALTAAGTFWAWSIVNADV